MAETSKIEWTDSTFNPWIGCTKISPACDHCYAEAQMDTRMGRVQWGAGQPRSRTSAAYWKQPLRWNAERFVECPACRWRGSAADFKTAASPQACPGCGGTDWSEARRRVFCASLADVFDNEVDPIWRADLISLIGMTPNLDWLLLTKRIGNAAAMLKEAKDYWGFSDRPGKDWQNIWLGATICNQAEADRDIPKLLATPAAKRFLSIEPMLGPIDMARWLPAGRIANRAGTREPIVVPHFYMVRCAKCGWTGSSELLDYVSYGDDGQCYCPDCKAPADTEVPGLDWIICGGESGPHARPMHPYWAGALRDQCAAAGVPFLFKQWGCWLPINHQADAFTSGLYRSNRKAAPHQDQDAIDESYGRTCTVPYGVVHIDGSFHQPMEPMAFRAGTFAMTTFNVGKHRAGRLLDGVEHNGVPA